MERPSSRPSKLALRHSCRSCRTVDSGRRSLDICACARCSKHDQGGASTIKLAGNGTRGESKRDACRGMCRQEAEAAFGSSMASMHTHATWITFLKYLQP